MNARLVAALALGGQLCSALEVVTPALGEQVIAERIFTVEWTKTTPGHRRFNIDLYYCGSSCTNGYCGDFVAALCPDEGCPDTAGDYDVRFPEPAGGVSSDGYALLVTDTDDQSDVDCSGGFTLVPSVEIPAVGESGGPVLEVVLPAADDEFVAGDEGVVKFLYDNGLGSSVDRFSIDMFESPSCAGGSAITLLCDKPEVGCRIRDGNYMFTIPRSTPVGTYTVKVTRFEGNSPADCSQRFHVVSAGSNAGTTSDEDSDNVNATDNGSSQTALSQSQDELTPAPTAAATNPVADSTTSPLAVAAIVASDDDSGAGFCDRVTVELNAGAVSNYSGAYSALGTFSGRSRFVRDDNAVTLEYQAWEGQGHWIMTGLETTFWVVSNADDPSKIECTRASSCWWEQTDSGRVASTVEILCSPDSAMTFSSSISDSSVAAPTGNTSLATCTQVVVETGDEATSMYSGIYDALGTAFGKPRFVRVDNKAMLEGTTMNGEEQWILTGLKTTLWVVSDATHPVDITCNASDMCWKEQTSSGEVVVTTTVSCTSQTGTVR